MALGADAVGISPAKLPAESLHHGPQAYEDWVAAGMHGTMNYMARDPGARSEIAQWFKPAKSVVLLVFSYSDAPKPDHKPSPDMGRIARYALSADYHRELKSRLKTLVAKIQEVQSGARAKIFVDTSPVLERLYARYAGIGWVGKNTLILSKKIGSFFFLCGFALDQELAYDEPVPDHCGSCTRCLDACPTDAFPQARVLDASKCIAYFTIEHRGAIPEGFRKGIGNWVFGCDICQEVCPWNRFAVVNDALRPQIPAEMPLEQLASLNEERFQRELAFTPLERAGRRGLVRNALLAMENSEDPKHQQTLEGAAADLDPVIAEQARWSLNGLKKVAAAGILFLLSLAPLATARDIQSSDLHDAPKGIGESQPEPQVPTVIPGEMKHQLSETRESRPWYIRAVMEPVHDGMFLHLPVVDTDPNRGVTYGIMPIWVLKGKDERIQYIHAPSLTYNRYFRVTPTYRFFYYPTTEAKLHAEASYSQVSDRNLMAEYDDYAFLGHNLIASLRLQRNTDGSNRFFGIGPDTPRDAESNFKQRTMEYRAAFGLPAYPGADRWKWIFANSMGSDRISNGPIASLPGIDYLFPSFVPSHWHQHTYFQASLNYDSRDSPITTSEGAFANLSAQTSQSALGSEYTYQRYGVDTRYFYKWPHSERQVTAGNLYFDQVVGTAPFWLLPQLGGKYVFRAYGAGRYVDNGLLTANVEQRITISRLRLSGVLTEFQVAPFAGLGTVFDTPGAMASKYVRPVYGTALRAVAKPQVVGSVDFGIGREGLSAFMDIDYSF